MSASRKSFRGPRGLALVTLLFALASCGGGDDTAEIGPIWIPTDVAAVDIDGDGRTDVVTLASYSTGYLQKQGYLLVYLQTATPGVFAAPTTYVFGQYPWRMAIGDVDGDGNPDIAVTDVDSKTVWLLLQDPARRGEFKAAQPLLTGVYAYDAVIADLNNDGAPDVAVADSNTFQVVIRYQDPLDRGAFASQGNLALPGRAAQLGAGDIDADGLPDLLAWVYTSPLGVYPATGGLVAAYEKPGGFDLSAVLASQTGQNVARLAVADMNGDGRRDLFAYETPFGTDFSARLAVVPQSTAPRAYDAPLFTSLAGVQGIDDAALADLNRDGLPDAAVVGFFPVGSPSTVESHLNLFINDGAGSFTLSSVVSLPIATSRVAAGDLDGDGRTDLVLLGDRNRAMVMFQTPAGSFLAPRLLY